MKLDRFFKNKSSNLFIQIVRYGISGGLAFTVDFLLLYLLTDIFNVFYLTSSIISFSVGVLTTYVLSIAWIFDKRRIDNKWTEFLIFASIAIVGLAFTYFFMQFFTENLQIHYLISKIITTIIVTLWNFAAKRIILFSKKV